MERKSFQIMKKKPDQTQDDFKDDVCMEYNEFFEDFLLEGGIYYEIYSAIEDYTTQQGVDYLHMLKRKTFSFANRVSAIIQIAKQLPEAIAPEGAYFRAIYFDYDETEKTLQDKYNVTVRFLKGLDNLARELDDFYDAHFPVKSTNGIIFYNREGQELKEFKKTIINTYIQFAEEFFSKSGIYHELYKAMLEEFLTRDEGEMKGMKRMCEGILEEQLPRVEQVIDKKTTIPIPDIAYFRRTYRQYKSGAQPINYISTDFRYCIMMLEHKIDLLFQ